MKSMILIVDFGSQYTQLIARRVREAQVYCEIVPFHSIPPLSEEVKGVILSGSPCSVNDPGAPDVDLDAIIGKVPLIGLCYGAQLLAKKYQGKVEPSSRREYGRARFVHQLNSPLFESVEESSQVWMSHSDTITQIPEGYHLTGSTESVRVAAFQHDTLPVYALQFHPEVTHTAQGFQIILNFITRACNIVPDWTPAAFVESSVASLRQQIGNDRVICGLSGGVDSTVAATL
ncbi:MAG: glutamine-hydrolyzing GMP synthase, partial [Bacteroidetes bacterium]